MASGSIDGSFIVWGIDQTAYGPVELPTLIAWVKDERISEDTWIFAGRRRCWQRAAELSELKMFFQKSDPTAPSLVESLKGIDLSALRRVNLLATLSDPQLERFSTFIELEQAAPGSVILKHGEVDDAMFLVLEGELSLRMPPPGQGTALATLGVGDFFGDVSLFEHGPRSGDVIVNRSCVLVKISSLAFERLTQEAPDLATPLLLALGKSLSNRIRAGDQQQSVAARPSRSHK